MHDKSIRVHSDEVAKAALGALIRRGVTLEDIAKIVYEMQKAYNDGLTLEHCIHSVERVLRKREVQHAVLVGIELDELAEKSYYHHHYNKLLNRMKDYSALMKQLHLDLYLHMAA